MEIQRHIRLYLQNTGYHRMVLPHRNATPGFYEALRNLLDDPASFQFGDPVIVQGIVAHLLLQLPPDAHSVEAVYNDRIAAIQRWERVTPQDGAAMMSLIQGPVYHTRNGDTAIMNRSRELLCPTQKK